jgi:hypothetical protein
MASWTGVLYNPPSMSPTQMNLGPSTATLVTPTLVPQFKMTGYFSGVPEVWTAYNYPNTTPPSGHTLSNITYVRLS